MKQFKLSFLLFVLMSMMSNKASADSAKIDGIYYALFGNQATVINKGISSYEYDEYSGSIVIPETVNYNSKTYTVTKIDWYAFQGCTGLNSIEIPSSVTRIENFAFEGCTGLTSIEIPSSVTIIGSSAFEGCTGLTSVKIQNGVTGIGGCVFLNCSNLTSIEIPNSVRAIGAGAFVNTPWYNNKPDGLLYINKLVYCYKGTMPSGTSIVLEDGTKYINYWAFYGCSGLTSIEIPSSVTSIVYQAFYGCSALTSIEIPSSVTSIDNGVFEECNSLTTVKVNWDTPISISSDVFSNSANATLYVPRGSKAAYEAADYWKDFKKIVEYDANVEITMGSSGITTYSSNYNLDFTSVSGLKAYIASGFSPSSGELTMLRIYKVPAGEGVLLKGEPGSYEVPGLKSDYIYANMFVGVPTATTVEPTDGEYTNFILANDEVKGIGFYPLASAGEIGPNKAYLQVLSSAFAAARSLRMVFEDEEEGTTGISASLNDKGQMMNDKPIFDLQGRRVANPTRGLYIKDGKKIMVK